MADEVRTVSSTGGEKGVKDAQLAWADPQSLMELAKVYGYGASKYAPTNYRKGYEWSKSYSAMQRHLAAFWGGEDLDPESGLPHLAHAAWHCMTLLTFMREHPQFDDRYKPPLMVVADDWTPTKDLPHSVTYSASDPVPTVKNVHGNEIRLTPGSGVWNENNFKGAALEEVRHHNALEEQRRDLPA